MPEDKHKNSSDLRPMDLVATTAHELKSPLVLISGLAGMLKSGQFGKLSRHQSRYISRIDGASERLLAMVENLLTINRSQHGRLKLELEPIGVPQVVEKVLGELHPRIRERKMTIVWTPQLRTPPVLADAQLLHQVFFNLLDNAIKYSPQKSTVTISFHQSGELLKVKIKDQGYGIQSSDLDKLFNHFGKTVRPISGQSSSSGLGLYIVKSLVEALGGKVSASRLSRGSLFTVTLPAVRQLELFDEPR